VCVYISPIFRSRRRLAWSSSGRRLENTKSQVLCFDHQYAEDAIRDDEIEISDFKMSDPKEKEFAHLKERTKTFFLEWKRQLLNETFIKLEQMLAEKAKANE